MLIIDLILVAVFIIFGGGYYIATKLGISTPGKFSKVAHDTLTSLASPATCTQSSQTENYDSGNVDVAPTYSLITNYACNNALAAPIYNQLISQLKANGYTITKDDATGPSPATYSYEIDFQKPASNGNQENLIVGIYSFHTNPVTSLADLSSQRVTRLTLTLN